MLENNSDKQFFMMESIKQLRADQKDCLLKLTELNEKFYLILKEHMDKEDIRWEFVLKELESLKIKDIEFGSHIALSRTLMSKLWVIIAPILVTFGLFLISGRWM